MEFDMEAHDNYFGVAEDRKKPGGSNAGKYKGKGPFCGPSGGAPKGTYPVDTRKRAIAAIAYARNAPNPAGIKACVCRNWPDLEACKKDNKKKDKQTMTVVKQTIPKAALHLIDHEGFAKAMDVDGKESLQMVAYSGGVIKGHWYWGDLLIDLAGMSFPKSKYPILEDHQTAKKIAFARKPDISMGMIEFNDAEYVDTPESTLFRKLSKTGFPYEASIYATPTSVERVSQGEKADANGLSIKGPASIWRKSIFKEASVCVFGYDSNTKSAAFTGDEEITLETVSNARSDQSEEQLEEEVKGMDFEQFSKEHPELLAEIVQKTTDDVTAALTGKFTTEKKALEDKLAQERDGREGLEKEIAALQKSEAIRTEKELRFEARNIWVNKLNESTIPDRLYDKVMNQVGHSQFVKDGELDREAFGKAIEAEIKDWESRGVTSGVSGFGVSIKDVDDEKAKKLRKEEDADASLAERMFALAGGKGGE